MASHAPKGVTHVVPVRNQGPREVRTPAQGHRARGWLSRRDPPCQGASLPLCWAWQVRGGSCCKVAGRPRKSRQERGSRCQLCPACRRCEDGRAPGRPGGQGLGSARGRGQNASHLHVEGAPAWLGERTGRGGHEWREGKSLGRNPRRKQRDVAWVRAPGTGHRAPAGSYPPT